MRGTDLCCGRQTDPGKQPLPPPKPDPAAATAAGPATTAPAQPHTHLVPGVVAVLGGKWVELRRLLPAAGAQAVRLGQQLVLPQDDVVVAPALLVCSQCVQCVQCVQCA